MARCSITGWAEPIKYKDGSIVEKDGVHAHKVEPRVEVYESKDKLAQFGLETWVNIVQSKGDEYTINGAFDNTPRRTAKLLKNGDGDELYYTKGADVLKFHLRPGVSEAVSLVAREAILIQNEKDKNQKKKTQEGTKEK